ncbi:MAG: YraN family protein [Wenzhouxiangellaceae bacterium]|nr:YraN family protein [Wenzhouxiangellaceae bacterium]
MFKRQIGDQGEQRAEAYLKANGLKLVARNWHCRHGEIDLIMFDDEYLIFVEVRLRTPKGFANSAESVDIFKQRKLIQAASYYLSTRPAWQTRPCRFDVVGIEGDTQEISWISHAFELEA